MNIKSIAAVGVVALLGLTACSSDKKVSQSETTSDAGSSATTPVVPGGGLGTIPGGSIPNIAGVSEDCMKLVQAMTGAFSGQNTDSLDALPDALNKIGETAPDNMKADFKTMAAGYAKLADLYKKYNNDFTKIATDADAMKLFSDPEFTKAASNVSDYMSTQCPTK